MNLSSLFNYLAQNSGLRGLMAFTAIAALILGIKYYRRHLNLRMFPWYIGFSLVQSATEYYKVIVDKNDAFVADSVPEAILIIVTDLFMVFEFLVCCRFILLSVSSPALRRFIRIDAWLFAGVLLYVIGTSYQEFFHISYFFWEAIFLIPPCLIYFYELLMAGGGRPLKDEPAFWIITGIFLLNAGSIPLLIMLEYLGPLQNAAWSLNYVFYSIFFCLIMKAYFCPPAAKPESGNMLRKPLVH